MVNTRQEPDWKPRKKGKIYCSPACGYGCTHASYKRALAQSKRARKILGPGWAVTVYELSGSWRWIADCPNVCLVLFPRAGGFSVNLHGRLTASGGTITEALQNTKTNIQESIRSYLPAMRTLGFSDPVLDFISKMV